MYSYKKEKAELFTDEGQRMFLKVRDKAKELTEKSGAVTAFMLMRAAGSGSSWTQMACIDRLVELGEIRLVDGSQHDAWQNRIYTAR